MKPELIEGDIFSDSRGRLFHINDFDLSPVKRMYVIENKSVFQYRGWKGHSVERRWFYCSVGSIELHVTPVSSFETNDPKIKIYNLSHEKMEILFVPRGYATLIKQGHDKSRLLVMSDYLLGDSNDEDLIWESKFFIK
ncbi:MAG: sugar epimerase [Schleiferiaceae bacterium]|nr:sugar epimerase [Schleiferiaceae bacterium]